MDLHQMAPWVASHLPGADKATKLLELTLMANHDVASGYTVMTRAQISEQTGWTTKTLTKALDSLAEDGHWEFDPETSPISFRPIADGPDAAPHAPLAEVVMNNSSLSGSQLLCAIYVAHISRHDESVFSVAFVSEALGLSPNTVRRAINAMIESGEWKRGDHRTQTRLWANRQTLSINRSSLRHSGAPRGSGAPFSPIADSSLPLILEDVEMMDRTNIRPFRPARSPRGYAERAYNATTPAQRASRRGFSANTLERVYTELLNHASPEVVDTLVHYQLHHNRALSMSFLRPVAKRVAGAVTVGHEPMRFKDESSDSGGYCTAVDVYQILQARHRDPETEYERAERLDTEFHLRNRQDSMAHSREAYLASRREE